MAINNMPMGVTAVMLPDLDFDEQIELCRKTGVTHYSLRPRVIPDTARNQPFNNWGNHKFDLTPDRLRSEGRALRRRLEEAGLTPYGTLPVVAIDQGEDVLKLNLEGAAEVGAGRMRIGGLSLPDKPFDFPSLLQLTHEKLAAVVELSRPLGIKLVFETHAGTLASGPGVAREICKPFRPADVGVIFDIANYGIEGNLIPHVAVSVLREYIDHCHVGGTRRTAGDYDPVGFRQAGRQMCPLSESDLHIPAWIAALRNAGVAVPLIIEDFTPNLPGALRLTQSAAALHRLLESL